MAGILDQNDSVLATERTDLFEIAGLSGQMYSNQRFWKGVGAHSLLQFLIQCHYIEVTGSRVNVDKINVGIAVSNAVRRGNKTDRRNPNCIFGANIQNGAGQMKRSGAVTASNHMRHLAVIGQSLFESGNSLALGQIIRFQYGNDGFYIGIADRLAAIRDHSDNTCWFMLCSSAIDRKC